MNTRIKTIKGVSLKGQTFSHDLDPVTVFTGRNGAGKSARIDTILLALAGAHPKLGKQNSALFRLSSGSVMAAHATMSDGQFVERRWSEKKGSVSMERIGCDLNVPPVALDAAEYFAMSDRDRLALVFRISGAATGEYGPNIAAKVKAIKLDEPTPETEKLCAAIAAEIMGDWTGRKEGTPAQWLDGFAATAKQKQSDLTAAAKRMTGAVAGISELRAAATRPAQDAERERERAQTAYNELVNEASRLEAKVKEHHDTAARREQLARDIAEARHRTSLLDADRNELAELERELVTRSDAAPHTLAALREATEKLRAVRLKLSGLQDEHASAERQRTARAEFDAILDPTGENETVLTEAHEFTTFNAAKVDGYRSRLPECEQAVNNANNLAHRAQVAEDTANENLAALLKERERLTHLETCPYCKSAGTAWKTTLAEELAGKIAAATKALDAAKADNATALAKCSAARRDHEEALRQHEEQEQLKTKLAEARSNYALAEADKRRAAEGMKLLTARSLTEIESEERKAELELEAAKAADTSAMDEHEAAKKQAANLFAKRSRLAVLRSELLAVPDYASVIARLEGELAALPPETNVDTMTDAMHRLAEAKATAAKRLETARQAEKDLIMSRAEAATKLKAADKAEATRIEADIWKQVRQFVEDEQAEAVQTAFTPMLRIANSIVGKVLGSPLTYRDGELGRMNGRTWVSHHTFSGSEQAVTYAALSVALAAQSPLRIAIVDELDRLTTENKQALMEAVVDAIQAGTLDQFCGCDVRPTDYAGLNQVTTINL